jgi:hypothetical protein
MGSWGPNSFENDDALDWVYDLEESTDTSVIVQALEAVTDNDGAYIEAPVGSVAIAAAEVVAALKGHGASSLPREISEWIEDKPRPDASLIGKARQAIDVVLAESELKELWEENAEDYSKWVAALEQCKARLAQ